MLTNCDKFITLSIGERFRQFFRRNVLLKEDIFATVSNTNVTVSTDIYI